ncbi:MAG: hypothetical protein ACP5LM_04230 [Thermoplasmata archaeon]
MLKQENFSFKEKLNDILVVLTDWQREYNKIQSINMFDTIPEISTGLDILDKLRFQLTNIKIEFVNLQTKFEQKLKLYCYEHKYTKPTGAPNYDKLFAEKPQIYKIKTQIDKIENLLTILNKDIDNRIKLISRKLTGRIDGGF